MNNNQAVVPAWKRLKLQLRWIVFEDQQGNFVMMEPNRPRVLGMDHSATPPPMVRIGLMEGDYFDALESLLWDFQHMTNPSRRHLDLVARVEEARDRFAGLPKEAAA